MKLPIRCLVVAVALLQSVLVGCGAESENAAGLETDGDGETEVAVEVGSVVRTTVREYLDCFGVVEPAPASSKRSGGAAYLTAPVAGIVREVLVAEGSSVEAGDLVIRLEDRMAQADVERARAELRLAEETLARQQALLAGDNTSQKRYQQALRAKEVASADLKTAEGLLAQVQLRAPLAGKIARIGVLPGQSVDLNRVVAEIVDPHRSVVTLAVPVFEAERVRNGQMALVSRGEAPEVVAKVSFVSPAVDPQTDTVMVRLDLPQAEKLRPGLFVRVRIVVAEHSGRLAVPRSSVYTDAAGRSTVSIVKGDTATRQEVRVGTIDGDLVEVVEGPGILEGTAVVTTGSYGLPETTKIRRVPTSGGHQ